MISTDDPRIPFWLRRHLLRLLRPGETIRRPKGPTRPVLPCPEKLRREYLSLIIRGKSDRKACVELGHKYGRKRVAMYNLIRKTFSP